MITRFKPYRPDEVMTYYVNVGCVDSTFYSWSSAMQFARFMIERGHPNVMIPRMIVGRN